MRTPKRLALVEQRIDELERARRRQHRRLAALEEKLGPIESGLAEIKARIGELASGLGESAQAKQLAIATARNLEFVMLDTVELRRDINALMPEFSA